MEQTLELTHLAADADGETVAAAMAESGAVVIDELAPPALVERILGELDPYLAATEPGPDEFSGLQHPPHRFADRALAGVA